MENYVVSARKYRPDSFETVVGQPSITKTLKNAIKLNQLAHAYLFCGPRGVGKTTCARIFAKTINCQQIEGNTEACGNCESCQSFIQNRSFTIHELDAASNNHVDDIRNLIDQVRIPPQVGKYSIYIIDEVHMLSQQAFNAFLKTLEEPPAHAIFILATTEKHKILPTILSRCQIFDFNRINVSDIMEHLSEVAVKEKVNADDAALNIIAQKADGSMRDALSIFDQVVSFSGQNVDYHTVVANLNVLDYEYYFVLTDAFLIGNYQSSLITYNDILNKGFDSHNFINGLGSHFRNLLVSRDAETIQLMELSGEIADKYLLGAKKCTVDWLFKGLSIINACDISYKQAKDPRLHIEIALLKLANLSGHVQSSATPAIVPEKLPEKSAVEKKAPISESVGEKVVHGNSVSSIDNEDDNKDDNENENSAVDTVEKPKSSEPAATYAKAPIDNGLKTGTRISDFLKKNNPSDDSNSESEKPIEDSPVELLDCTNEQILVLWKEFAESIKIEQPRLFNTLTSQLPELQDNMVLVHSNNPLQLKALKSIHFEIEGFLKQKTGNDKLQLQHEMKDHPGGEKKLYTQEDKYRHLQQKNPDLDLFKQTFKLDHE